MFTALEYSRSAAEGMGDAAAAVQAIAEGLVRRSGDTVGRVRKAYRESGGWLLAPDVGGDEEEEEVKDELRRRQRRR
jgi:hypothetical protein